jgi:hypothetical protein
MPSCNATKKKSSKGTGWDAIGTHAAETRADLPLNHRSIGVMIMPAEMRHISRSEPEPKFDGTTGPSNLYQSTRKFDRSIFFPQHY